MFDASANGGKMVSFPTLTVGHEQPLPRSAAMPGSKVNRALPIQSRWLKFIERTPYRSHGLQNMRVYHRRLQTPMPEQELDRPDVSAGGQQVGCKAVAQAMDACVLSDLCPLDCLYQS